MRSCLAACLVVLALLGTAPAWGEQPEAVARPVPLLPPEAFEELSKMDLRANTQVSGRIHALVPRLSVSEAIAMFQAGQLILGDAREPDKYAQSHVLGAVSLPWNEIDALPVRLPREMNIAFYCN